METRLTSEQRQKVLNELDKYEQDYISAHHEKPREHDRAAMSDEALVNYADTWFSVSTLLDKP